MESWPFQRAIAKQIFWRGAVEYSYRDMSKRGGHGTNYFGTPYTMSQHLKVRVAVMEHFQRQYFTAFPEIPEWHTWVAQQLQMSIGKYRTMEVMSEVTLSVAAEINSALQTIIGHCDLIERSYADPSLHRDLSTVVRQSQRIADLLEKMRVAAHERMREVADTMHQEGIPSSPEEWK